MSMDVPPRSASTSGTATVVTPLQPLISWLLGGVPPSAKTQTIPTTGLDVSIEPVEEKSMRKDSDGELVQLTIGSPTTPPSVLSSPKAGLQDPLKALGSLNTSQREHLGILMSSLPSGRLTELWRLSLIPSDLLPMLKGLFKPDHAYRTRLAHAKVFQSSAAGVVSGQYNVYDVVNANQWSAFTSLFDECFVHGFTVRYYPYNLQASIPASTTSWAGTGYGLPTIAGGSGENTMVYNAALIWVALFGNSSSYAVSAAGAEQMENNPTKKHARTDKPHSFAWKNNQRFDPHGMTLNPSVVTQGWCGWVECASAADLSGFAQVQTVGAVALGDLAHALFFGQFVITFDISFRERA